MTWVACPTIYPNDGDRDPTLANHVVGYLIKPFDHGALVACVHSAWRGPHADAPA